ncbi:hypothetical protein EVAR_19616_1 [Eumeta japonica]|uniref:Uncharacterized protein n=1 Tax=Eumeta variegata TaxID=151549 RepID=A0A4C1UGT4_EUMVA|nr:hypothetical protein EVAR_19616_1 [Eumeta japonica]
MCTYIQLHLGSGADAGFTFGPCSSSPPGVALEFDPRSAGLPLQLPWRWRYRPPPFRSRPVAVTVSLLVIRAKIAKRLLTKRNNRATASPRAAATPPVAFQFEVSRSINVHVFSTLRLQIVIAELLRHILP